MVMSAEDEALLEKARPELIKRVDLEGSDLLVQLRRRHALRVIQEEKVKVGSLCLILIST